MENQGEHFNHQVYLHKALIDAAQADFDLCSSALRSSNRSVPPVSDARLIALTLDCNNAKAVLDRLVPQQGKFVLYSTFNTFYFILYFYLIIYL